MAMNIIKNNFLENRDLLTSKEIIFDLIKGQLKRQIQKYILNPLKMKTVEEWVQQ